MAAATRWAPSPLLERWLLAGPPDGVSRWRLTGEEVGRVGEELAARWLRARGVRLLGRNLEAPEGELDLLALEGAELVVVEVKAGWCPAWAPEDSPWRPAARLRREPLARRARAAARR
ncbi:MAG: YraN family protein, partial [Planctomycetota bacterium]|nr:YraN family protein [Planctomycetota bacterium]